MTLGAILCKYHYIQRHTKSECSCYSIMTKAKNILLKSSPYYLTHGKLKHKIIPSRHIRSSTGKAPILNGGTRLRQISGQLLIQTVLPQGRTSVPIELVAGWTPELVWAYQRSQTSLASLGNQTQNCPDHSLVTIRTELSRISAHSKWENTFLEP